MKTKMQPQSNLTTQLQERVYVPFEIMSPFVFMPFSSPAEKNYTYVLSVQKQSGKGSYKYQIVIRTDKLKASMKKDDSKKDTKVLKN